MNKRLVTLLAALGATVGAAAASGTAFTYQGRLGAGGNPANGIYDLKFTLCNDATAGSTVGSPMTTNGVAVSNGLFTVAVDFGSVFDGGPLWLEIGVRTNGAVAFTSVVPRQALTASPYALYALNAGTVAIQGLPPAVVTNGQAGVNLTGTFTGNGSGLTNLLPQASWHALEFTNNIVVCDGDSRTSASGGYFGHLAGGLFFSNRVAAFYNVSAPGTGLGQGMAQYTNVIQPHKPGPGQVGYLLEWYGINDLLSVDGQTTFNNKTSYWAMAKADGFKVITLTLPPANDGYNISVVYPRTQYGQFDANRRRLNDLIRRSALPDGVVDVAALLPDANDTSLVSDGVHFTPAGAELIAQAISAYLMTMGRPAMPAPGVTTNVTIGGTTLVTKGGMVTDVQVVSNGYSGSSLPGLSSSNYVTGDTQTLLVSGAGTASANGTYRHDPGKDFGGLPGYTNVNGLTAIVFWAGWYDAYVLTNGASQGRGNAMYYSGPTDPVTDPWYLEYNGGGTSPPPVVQYYGVVTNYVTRGSFAGDGGGLTNLTHLPSYVLTNGASSVSLSGSFAGSVSGSILLASNGIPPAGLLARFAPKPPKVLGSFYAQGFELAGNTNFNENWVRRVADQMSTNGMLAAGWDTVRIDDGWQGFSRDAAGNLTCNSNTFPGGISNLVWYIHSKGLKAGIYTAFDGYTCLGFHGTPEDKVYGDVATFYRWGADHVMVDACHAGWTYAYTEKMGRLFGSAVLQQAGEPTGGRPMTLFLVSLVRPQPYELGCEANVTVAAEWEVPIDVEYWLVNLKCVQVGSNQWHRGFYPFAGAASWGVSDEQKKQGMCFWAMASASPVIGPPVYGTLWQPYINPEVIAIMDDPGVICPRQAWSNQLAEIWVKPLGGAGTGTNAVLLANPTATNRTFAVDWSLLGLAADQVAAVRDAYYHTNAGVFTGSWTNTVAGNTVGLFTVAALPLSVAAMSFATSAGPTITSGADAPSRAEPNGSLYLRTTGQLYIRTNDTWVAR